MRRVSESYAYPTAEEGDDTERESTSPTPERRHVGFAHSTPEQEQTNQFNQSTSSPQYSCYNLSYLQPQLASGRTQPQRPSTNQLQQSPPSSGNGALGESPAAPPTTDRTDVAPQTHAMPSYPAHKSTTDRCFVETGRNARAPRASEEPDAAQGALLIYPKKIDNLRRFRILFVGLLVIISSSTQGVHSLFGTLYLQVLFKFNVRKMAIVYLCGQAFGMFVFPFGMLYDWFGPRIVVAVGSVIAAVGHLLFALTFGGHIEATVSNCAIFYAIMCWGCYALDVAVLPAVLTHMPRDRGQPTGLLETFSGLGSSFFSCLFRGFFSNNYENLMWFMFAVTVVVGVVGTWYLEDAPYMVNRWQQLRITPREQLRKYLMRNRYMSQLVPQRRYMIMTVILVLLNFYLTIQAVVVSYLASQMTDGKRRGIAIGAIVIVLFLLVLLIPVNAIDGPTEQDKQVIEAAKEKEEQIRELNAEHVRRTRSQAGDHRDARTISVRGENTAKSDGNPLSGARDSPAEEVRVGAGSSAVHSEELYSSRVSKNVAPHEVLSISDDSFSKPDAAQVRASASVPVPPPPHHSTSSPAHRHHHHHEGGMLTQRMGLPLYKPVTPERSLISVDVDDMEEVADTEDDVHKPSGKDRSPSHSGVRRRSKQLRLSLSLSASRRSPPAASAGASRRESSMPTSPQADMSYIVHVDERGNVAVDETSGSSANAEEGDALMHTGEYHAAYVSEEHPRVEAITLCGDVYVAPVYRTTFWESLTYLDIWLMFYVTMCVWGVGLTMVGNWNIYIMLLARYGAMEQKHYILFAAIAGVTTAGGRVFIGLYERLLKIIRERTGVAVAATALYPITSIGLLIGTIFWIALPGDKVLVLAYILGPAFYGISSSLTPYVLGTIFDRDLGMHYGFCFVAGAVGFVLCFWCSWYLTYRDQTTLTPRGYMCVGHRRCMNRAVGIYVALVFSSIFPAYILHRRYSKLVSGKFTQRRVIVSHLKRMFHCCGCCCDDDADSDDNGDANDSSHEAKKRKATSKPHNTNPLVASQHN